MGYHSRSNEPVSNTCPIIDKAIRTLGYIEFNEDDDPDCKKYIDETIYILEDIRDRNSQLRSWGKENGEQADKFEEERNELQSKVEDLESEIEDLKKEIEDLKAIN